MTTRSSRILSVDVVGAALLQRSVDALEQQPLAALVDAETRVVFQDRLAALSEGSGVGEWRLRLRGPDDTWIDLVADVRSVAGDGGDTELEWSFTVDPRPAEASEDTTTGTDMTRVLRKLAHELNQPLAAIVTYARGSQMRLDGNTLSVADLRAALEVIVKEAMRATEIVRALDRRWGKP